MQLTVLTWLKEFLVPLIGKFIEVFFRILLLSLPMGLYILLIQLRQKASSTSNISVYTTDNSTWQHIFPGFILVSIDSKGLKNSYSTAKTKLQLWINSNKYILGLLFMIIIVALMILNEVVK